MTLTLSASDRPNVWPWGGKLYSDQLGQSEGRHTRPVIGWPGGGAWPPIGLPLYHVQEVLLMSKNV